jgi:hypothetical protein
MIGCDFWQCRTFYIDSALKLNSNTNSGNWSKLQRKKTVSSKENGGRKSIEMIAYKKDKALTYIYILIWLVQYCSKLNTEYWL